MHIATVAIVVREYDEAIIWFVEKLGFELREDKDLGDGKRWVRVAPAGGATDILLARAVTPKQTAAIGNANGGRVSLFLHSDNFSVDYDRMKTQGIEFVEEPRCESYGWVVVFIDLYGNKWDLVERRTAIFDDGMK
jgi:catechol 2,3-dioxygenase-like lactoylglutathione lyase family enzyme